MNPTHLLRRTHLILPTVLVMAAQCAHGSIRGTYTSDPGTVVLLHLDESAPSGIATNAASSTNFVASANPSSASPRSPLAGILGAAGASGIGYSFGKCASLSSSNSMGLFMDSNLNGVADLDTSAARGADQVAMSSLCGPAGEFTLEALVNLPALSGANREIISMETSASVRPFQFRITSTGQIEFNNIGTAGANPKVNIPTTGADAFVANQWFHVALTYDGAGNCNIYWTKLDNARTGANLLQTFTGVPALNETGLAVVTIGNENRNTSGEGLMGLIDEVRISKVARGATEMLFDTKAPPIPPTISPQPVDQFLGVGETLAIQSHASGSPVLQYVWQHDGGTGFTNLEGQVSDTLSLPVTFATEGGYRYIVNNAYGSVTSAVAQVSVGGTFAGLFPTGMDGSGVLLVDGAVDPHYKIWSSVDPALLGPDTVVPPNTLDYNANDTASKWIAPSATLGGVRGVYTYRISFLLDAVDPAASGLAASVLSGGGLTVKLNGHATSVANMAPPFPGPHRNNFSFVLTNGFVAGLNTLDFVVDNQAAVPNSPGGNALRVMSIRGVGKALAAGAPVIISEPGDATVREGGAARFAVVAGGRPPLRYQWFDGATGAPAGSGESWILAINPVQTGSQPSSYVAVVSNDSGSVTSRVATLTLVPNNQSPTAPDVNLVSFGSQVSTIDLSSILQKAGDADGDTVSFSYFDVASTNVLVFASNNVVQVGAALQYYGVEGYVGADRFSYTLSDSLGALGQGYVNIVALAAPVSQVVNPGAPSAFSVGVAAAPAGYSFQWKHNGTAIPGATLGRYEVASAQLSDAGAYNLIATSAAGSWASAAAILTVGTPGTGAGLRGDYYNIPVGSSNFVGAPAISRVDPMVNFLWDGAQPDPLVNATQFMVRWHGSVEPVYSDLYTFSTATDDGVRLWVNGQLLVSDWNGHAVTTNSGTIALVANQKYSIVMEYYQGTGIDSAYLLWSSEHQARGLIPASQLYAGSGLLQAAITPAVNNRTNLVLNWPGTFDIQTAADLSGPWSTIGTNILGPWSVDLRVEPKSFYRLATPQ